MMRVLKGTIDSDALQPFQKMDTVARIFLAQYNGEARKGMPLGTPKEVDGMIASMPGRVQEITTAIQDFIKASGGDIKEEYAKNPHLISDHITQVGYSLMAYKRQLIDEQARDSSQYMVTHSPEVKKLWMAAEGFRIRGDIPKAAAAFAKFDEVSIREQTRVGIPKSIQRHIPKGRSQDFQVDLKTMMATTTDSTRLEQFISSHEDLFGPKAQQVYDEMQSNGDVPPLINFVRTLPLAKRGKLLTDAANKDALYEQSSKSKNIRIGDAHMAVSENEAFRSLQRQYQAPGFSNNIKFTNDMQEALSLRVYQEYFNKHGDEGTLSSGKLKDITEQVMGEYLTSTMHISEGDHHSIAVPMETIRIEAGKNVNNSDMPFIAVVTKDFLISKDREYVTNPLLLMQLNASLKTDGLPQNDPRIQERLRKMLNEEGEVTGHKANGLVLTWGNQTMGYVVNGKIETVQRSWKEAIADPNVNKSIAKSKTVFLLGRGLEGLSRERRDELLRYSPEGKK